MPLGKEKEREEKETPGPVTTVASQGTQHVIAGYLHKAKAKVTRVQKDQEKAKA